jgi:hypothetical protein
MASTSVSATSVFQLATLPQHQLNSGCSRTHTSAWRTLASAKVSQLRSLCKQAQLHAYKVRFWLSKKHRWTLYLRHTGLTCGEMSRRNMLVGPESLCYTARSQVRKHGARLVGLVSKIRRLAAVGIWQADLAATASRRACVAHTETHGSSHPYTQQGGGGGNYWGKYQYDEGTWQTAVSRAETFYRIDLPFTKRASQAPPWEQEVVTAFALAHSDVLGWNPWQECR